MIRASLVVATLALVACLPLACGSSDSSSDPSFFPVDTDKAPDAATFATYPASAVVAAAAQCDAPPSAAVPFDSVSSETALLAGTWLYCPPQTDAGMPVAPDYDLDAGTFVGLHFTADNYIYLLAEDAAGDVSVAPPASAYHIEEFTNATYNNGSGGLYAPYVGVYLAFESDPRRMTMDMVHGSFVYLGK